MSVFITALQPDTSIISNLGRVKVGTIVSTDSPGFACTGSKIGHRLQDVDVCIAKVAGRYYDSIGCEDRLWGSFALRDRATTQDETDFLRILHVDDPDGVLVGEDAMLPLLFVEIGDLLGIHLRIDVLEQLGTDNAIVGTTVEIDRVLALSRGLVIDGIDTVGIEDLVDKGGVVAGSESGALDDQPSVRVGISRMEVIEDFCSALATAHDGNGVGGILIGKKSG
jgi:hypothetical protein